jgi:hypothetical protein
MLRVCISSRINIIFPCGVTFRTESRLIHWLSLEDDPTATGPRLHCPTETRRVRHHRTRATSSLGHRGRHRAPEAKAISAQHSSSPIGFAVTGAARPFIRPSIPEKFESRALLHWAFTDEAASMAHTGKSRSVFAMDTTKLPAATAMSGVQIFHCVYLLIPEAP